tara:strand:+ start:336 stop:881 length:546 start_codon:yes stop_codon:yes gene_type:complete
MRINVGSRNPTKLEAVTEVFQEYDFLKEADIRGIDLDSFVSDQPFSFEETLQGAFNRAKNCFGNADYSIGLESGILHQTRGGLLDGTICVIYNEEHYVTGVSSCFPVPGVIAERLLDGQNMSQATLAAGLTKSEAIGSEEGLIGILSKGHVTRKEYTKTAIRNALFGLQNLELYGFKTSEF